MSDISWNDYRSFFPEDGCDPGAGLNATKLADDMKAEILSRHPDISQEDLAVSVLESLEAMVAAVGIQKWADEADASFEDPCLRAKIGGLPYAEAGWGWPACPFCGSEAVFVAQARDPMTPSDLVQIFYCEGPDSDACNMQALEDSDTARMVRVWRDPDMALCETIAPSDSERRLPAHRLDAASTGAICSGVSGGIPKSHAFQFTEHDGVHCVLAVSLPYTTGRSVSEPFYAVRAGRGPVFAWLDNG